MRVVKASTLMKLTALLISLCIGTINGCAATVTDENAEAKLTESSLQTRTCRKSAGCPQPAAPCIQCLDGTVACPSAECIDGMCVAQFPTCDEPSAWSACQVDVDCGSAVSCSLCGDDPGTCSAARCIDGQCAFDQSACEPFTPDRCQTESDCPVLSVVCEQCPDGSSACPTSACRDGHCVVDLPTCATLER
jgi:hypothetical protein